MALAWKLQAIRTRWFRTRAKNRRFSCPDDRSPGGLYYPVLAGAQNKRGLGSLPALACLLDSAVIRPMGLANRLHVRSLPALGPLHHVELHGLTLLQALEIGRGSWRER